MLKMIAMGRLVADPTADKTRGGTDYTRFRIASARRFSNDGGEKKTDFVECIAWAKTAEFIKRFFKKGDGIVLEGDLETETKEKDGQRITYFSINVRQAEFPIGGSKSDGGGSGAETSSDKKEPVGAATGGGGDDYDPWANM